MSYANVRMYLEVLPTYDSKDDSDTKEQGEGTSFQGLLSTLKQVGDGR